MQSTAEPLTHPLHPHAPGRPARRTPSSAQLRPGRRWLRADHPTLGDALQAAALAPGELLGTRERSRLGRLQRRGLATDDGLVPWVADLLRVVTGADARFELTAFAAGEVLHHTIWRGPTRAAVADHAADGTVAIQQVDPHLLPASVAVAVGLTPTSVGHAEDPIDLPPAVLWRFVHALGDGRPADAAEVLRLGSLELPALRVLHGLAAGSVQAWGLQVGPVDSRVERSESLVDGALIAVVDAGRSGTWLALGGNGTFEPVPTEAVWRALSVGLVPVAASARVGSVAACQSCPRWRPSAGSSSRC